MRMYAGTEGGLESKMLKAAQMTAEAICSDVKEQALLPYAENSEENLRRGIVPGELQERTYPDFSRAREGVVSVVSSTPYARRLYFHPEYNFYQGHNRFAGGLWFEPYKTVGLKWVQDTYARFLEGML